jgi:hypothetical protein
MSMIDEIVVLGSGEANAPQPDLFDPKARATVRYADPASWTIAAAIAKALAEAKTVADLNPHEVGVISVSDTGPAETIGVVAEAALELASSPLRYPAASPGTMTGVACICFGLRGPTLNITMLPADGVGVAMQISSGWMKRPGARQMIVAALIQTPSKDRSARALLLSPASDRSKAGRPLTAALVDWLSRPGEVTL